MKQNSNTAVADNADTIDSCQRKISELVASTQGGAAAPEKTPDVAAVAKEIARYYVRMGDIFIAKKVADKAATCYETALQLDPAPWTPRMNRLKTRDVLTVMLEAQPRNTDHLNLLGALNYKLGDTDAALDCFHRVIGIDPNHADSLYWIAILQQEMGNLEAAGESYRRAIKVKPLLKVPASKPIPDFSVLAIFAPLSGNTPTEHLIEEPPYDMNILPLFPGTEYDIALLKSAGQVVVNLVSDADLGRDILPQATHLVDQLGMPVINHPAKIQKTTREGVAQMLWGIPNCRLAQIVRHAAGEPATAAALQARIPFSPPLLARPTGTHGGDDFEKIDSFDALEAFIRKHPGADHYLMEYLDYKSNDGYFRKYRFIFVDDKIMPYHLAIGSLWKVHHYTTDMADNAWMQDEEKAFLEKPENVFSPKLHQSLRAIRQAVGLEYFGIDCGIDPAGNLVVFEVNASMLVHRHDNDFPYKEPFVRHIQSAFGDMLRKRAGR